MKIATLFNTITTRSEEITGTVSGSIVGVIAHRTFADIVVTLMIATATGFLGYIGATLAKAFVKYIKR
jgi:hypothetical protein